MPNLPESLLALFAGRTRAATIYGDLVEMAHTRGRRWFLAAYLRTLFSLTWRIVLALFVADVGREFIFNLFHLYMSHTPETWRTTDGPFLLNSMGPLLGCIMSTLWFALPFAAVRYGVRDRFVRLTFSVALGTTVAFLFIPWASLAFAAATLALAAAALLSNTWRRPLEVLLWTGAAGLITIAAATALRLTVHLPAGLERTLVNYTEIFAFQASLLAVAVVCSRLHAQLLEAPPDRNSSPA